MTKTKTEELLEQILSKIEEQNKRIDDLEKRVSTPGRSPSLSEVGIVPEEMELSEDTKDKIRKAVDLILAYSRTIPYLNK
jgi:uncharacterized protein with von Willebrand factor type A (vWA) domain